MPSVWKGGGGGGGEVSEKLTKVDIGGGGGGFSYKVDINLDALKGWGKEKPK